MQRRDIASIAAAEALEEAISTESIIRSLRYYPHLFTFIVLNNECYN